MIKSDEKYLEEPLEERQKDEKDAQNGVNAAIARWVKRDKIQ